MTQNRYDCGRCGLPVEQGRGFVLYIHSDPTRNDRLIVHGECIADEVAEGRVVRTSPFAFRKS